MKAAVEGPQTCWALERKGGRDDGRPVTLGWIKREGRVLCVTAELPWLDNQNGRSCIRADMYEMIRHPRLPSKKVRLINPPGIDALRGRTKINGEVGNWPRGKPKGKGKDGFGKPESLGCFFPGLRFTDDRLGVESSADAVKQLIREAEECWAIGRLFLHVYWLD